MEIYFNPYPNPAESEEQAITCTIRTADALIELQKLVGSKATEMIAEENHILTSYVLCYKEGLAHYFQNMLTIASVKDKEKLLFLIRAFSGGRILSESELTDGDDWIACNTGVKVPILAHAVKTGAVSLTIPTSLGWDIDHINFEGRDECLLNIWGQGNLSPIHNHYLASIMNAQERFAVKFNATYCEGALNTAPDEKYWDLYKFFIQMDKAKNNDFIIDDDLIKNVGTTEKHGALRELRCYGDGWRIFFVCKDSSKNELLIGGFYSKGTKREQNREIKQAIKRINCHT